MFTKRCIKCIYLFIYLFIFFYIIRLNIKEKSKPPARVCLSMSFMQFQHFNCKFIFGSLSKIFLTKKGFLKILVNVDIKNDLPTHSHFIPKLYTLMYLTVIFLKISGLKPALTSLGVDHPAKEMTITKNFRKKTGTEIN